MPRCIEVRLISSDDFRVTAEVKDDGPGSAAFIGGRQESSDVLDKYKLPAESKPGAPEKKLTEQNQVLPQQTHTQKRQSPPPPLRKVPRQSAATHSAVSAFENRKSQQATVHSLEAEGQQTSGLAESTDKSSLPSAGSTSGGANSAMGGSGKHGNGLIEARFGADNGPRFAHQVQPKYPSAARQLGKEGTVLLRITIDEHGRPVDIEVLSKAGAGFEEEAVRAVRESTFVPARFNGEPVRSRAVLPVHFMLKNSS